MNLTLKSGSLSGTLAILLLAQSCATLQNDRSPAKARAALNCDFLFKNTRKNVTSAMKCEDNVNWKNHGSTVQNSVPVYVEPSTEEEVAEVVRLAYENSWKVRPVGSGHSWSQITQAEEILLGTHNLIKAIRYNKEKLTAVIGAGQTLKSIVQQLGEIGLALPNLGSTQAQTLAGVVSTNTHGTGITKTGFAGMVLALRIVNGKGQVQVASPNENSDLFYSALAGAGMVGVITELTIKIENNFDIALQTSHMNIDELFKAGPDGKFESSVFVKELEKNEWLSLFWPLAFDDVTLAKGNRATAQEIAGREVWRDVPGTKGKTLVKEGGRRTKSVTISAFVRNSIVRRLVSGIANNAESWNGFFNTAYNISKVVSGGTKKVYNYAQAISGNFEIRPWDWAFETEFFFPIEFLPAVMTKMKEYANYLEKEQIYLAAPFVGMRFLKGDNAYLSTAYKYKGYDRFVAFNVYDKAGPTTSTPWLLAVKKILQEAIGSDTFLLRQHLGKINHDGPASFRARYANWSKFENAREESDPRRIFLNRWTESFFK